jgi:hypothetical protein
MVPLGTLLVVMVIVVILWSSLWYHLRRRAPVLVPYDSHYGNYKSFVVNQLEFFIFLKPGSNFLKPGSRYPGRRRRTTGGYSMVEYGTKWRTLRHLLTGHDSLRRQLTPYDTDHPEHHMTRDDNRDARPAATTPHRHDTADT